MARLLGGLALLISVGLILPSLPAQDEDAKGKKAKKAADAKADDPEKKDDPKAKDKEPEEKVVYGKTVTGKLKRFEINTNRDLTLELSVIDPKKVYDVKAWQAQQSNSLTQQLAGLNQQFVAMRQARNAQELANARNAYANAKANYDKALYNFNIELTKRSANVYSPQDYDVRLEESAKIRSVNPPIEYDERGNVKVWTKKELDKLRGTGKLPGYPVEVDSLRVGQIVQAYMSKTKVGAAADKKAKKGIKLDDDAPPANPENRPEVVMIVIQQEPALKR